MPKKNKSVLEERQTYNQTKNYKKNSQFHCKKIFKKKNHLLLKIKQKIKNKFYVDERLTFLAPNTN